MKPSRALIYCRTAYPATDELEMQKVALTAFAEEQGFIVTNVVAENGSGLNYHRPGLLEVMETAQEGGIDVLLVKDLARLGRNILKTDALLHWLKKCDTDVICADGTVPQTYLETFGALLKHYHLSRRAKLE